MEGSLDSFHGFKYHSYTHAKNVYDAINVIKVGYGALYFQEIALTTQLLYSNVVYCCLVSNGLIIYFWKVWAIQLNLKISGKAFSFFVLERQFKRPSLRIETQIKKNMR